MIKKVLERWRFLGWDSIRRWGQSRILRTSYVWLIAIPIAAKSLEPLPDVVSLTIGGSTYGISLSLPFRWIVLYLMSVAFAIAQAVFLFRCPGIMRYANFAEYEARHHAVAMPLTASLVHLFIQAQQDVERNKNYAPDWTLHLSIILDASADDAKNDREAAPRRMLASAVRERDFDDPNKVIHFLNSIRREPLWLAEVFNLVRNHDGQANPVAIRASAAFFGIGFALFLWLCVDSFITVVKLAL